MHSFEDLFQMVVEVRAWLGEADDLSKGQAVNLRKIPPPHRAADRASAGMPALKARTGATPPPIPKPKPKVLAQGPTKAVVHSATPKGDKSLGIKRGFSMHTAAGAQSQPHATQALGWAKEKVAARAAKGESFNDHVDEIRYLLGEGGGSRASKDARQMKHYQATQPKWLRDTQAGKDPHYPYGMNKPSEKMYSRSANRDK